jgi:hypothetical protein
MDAEFDNNIKFANKHKIFIISNRISMPYYGKKLIYKIVEIETYGNKK